MWLILSCCFCSDLEVTALYWIVGLNFYPCELTFHSLRNMGNGYSFHFTFRKNLIFFWALELSAQVIPNFQVKKVRECLGSVSYGPKWSFLSLGGVRPDSSHLFSASVPLWSHRASEHLLFLFSSPVLLPPSSLGIIPFFSFLEEPLQVSEPDHSL